MAKISKKTIAEIQDFISLGCDYSGTKEYLDDTVSECLKKLMCYDSPDEIEVCDFTLDMFVRELYPMLCDGFINVLKTQD